MTVISTVEHECYFYELPPFSYSLFLREVIAGVKVLLYYFPVSSWNFFGLFWVAFPDIQEKMQENLLLLLP